MYYWEEPVGLYPWPKSFHWTVLPRKGMLQPFVSTRLHSKLRFSKWNFHFWSQKRVFKNKAKDKNPRNCERCQRLKRANSKCHSQVSKEHTNVLIKKRFAKKELKNIHLIKDLKGRYFFQDKAVQDIGKTTQDILFLIKRG